MSEIRAAFLKASCKVKNSVDQSTANDTESPNERNKKSGDGKNKICSSDSEDAEEVMDMNKSGVSDDDDDGIIAENIIPRKPGICHKAGNTFDTVYTYLFRLKFIHTSLGKL